MERVSDDDLAYFRRDMSAMDGEHVDMLLDEVIARRAADLTAEEMEALLDALDFAFKHTDETPTVKSARDKLLASGGGK